MKVKNIIHSMFYTIATMMAMILGIVVVQLMSVVPDFLFKKSDTSHVLGASSVSASICGNSILESGEECDLELMEVYKCSKYNSKFESGYLICNKNCTINTDDCN